MLLVEAAFAALNATTTVRAISGGFWAIALFAGLLAAGLTLVVWLTIADAVRGMWARRAGPRRGPELVVPPHQPDPVLAEEPAAFEVRQA